MIAAAGNLQRRASIYVAAGPRIEPEMISTSLPKPFSTASVPDERTLLFLGDSHLGPPRYAFEQGWFAPHQARFVKIGGATAVGLRHPTSKTLALVKYREALTPFKPDVVPVLHLGEVDCGFVIWHRAQQYDETIDEQLDAALKAYIALIDDTAAAGYRDLIVTSATLPTLKDGQLDGEVAHLRRSVTATQIERTALTDRYNATLKREVERRGIAFVDFTPTLADPQTGLIRDDFRHANPKDHHLDPDRGGRMWVEGVTGALARSRA